MRESYLQFSGLMLEMEIDEDGDSNDGQVNGQPKPGEKRSLSGTMITGI